MTETLSATMPGDVEALTHALLERAAAKDISLVTAESCTGGMLASLLTDVEGASHAFERGFVTYSEPAKCELLGLSQAMIDDCGAVSEPVARAMAAGALAASHGDVALAITGFAGPAGPNDEQGLVHFACAVRDGPVAHREVHLGPLPRGPIRIACMRIALEMLREAVEARSGG
ncbi:damage-inducible protein CinA [Sphingomonas sp. Root710]|uniref:CinA family protein n=1 Tax=Sphingomonas sp. Root710 TaxID=1736594 RepID=UPI0007004FD6|nr:nicotinamide-nucleotide amidohydrolase family protein [Sphingomonas sp. Root710]KRB81398.1 damage-inducible protein CinA [Sphingomonas sp. Root710]